MRRLSLLAVLAASACAPAGTGPPGLAPVPPGVSLVPAAEGLNVAGTGQEIGFGRHQPGAVAAVARVLGGEPDSTVARMDCPGGALTEVSWRRDGLTMYFAGAAFVGWAAGGGRSFAGDIRTAGRTCL